MRAESTISEEYELAGGATAQLVVWRLPAPVKGSTHFLKYRLALIYKNECVLRYDNEAGKGDHRHLGNKEYAYEFSDLQSLLADYWKDVDEWLKQNVR